jgi:hypothetical protein
MLMAWFLPQMLQIFGTKGAGNPINYLLWNRSKLKKKQKNKADGLV